MKVIGNKGEGYKTHADGNILTHFAEDKFFVPPCITGFKMYP